MNHTRTAVTILTLLLWQSSGHAEELPKVAKGFHVHLFAKEPLVRHPCAMTFDAKGRLFVSQGPQYRNPKPDTPGDRISILLDTDRDGVADQTKTFAEGFNHIQGLVWNGNDLWVANAPDLTVVRDLDGDDEADEYVLIYGGLGNLEHALHGLNFGPDGLLTMSKGNSKGYGNAKSSELRVAPKAFLDLWGIPQPSDAPDLPKPIVFKKGTYKRGYHHPSDDWGREGGILRCDARGQHLEIISRGMRNPWDIAYDEHFNWLGTDQDQDGGDRILSPFYGAHFGWGHPWSPHWSGEKHLPTMPVSGPLFHGSGTGIVYYASSQFPEKYRGVFFINDWLQRGTVIYRPQWDGAMMRNMTQPEIFVAAPGGRSLGSSSGMLYDPTDIEVGPDGALWIMSWGHGYGAKIEKGKQVDKGRVFRITYGNAAMWKPEAKRHKSLDQWTIDELIDDLRHDRLPVWRTNAQNELIRRGDKVKPSLIMSLHRDKLAPGAATWIAWTLGRLDLKDGTVDALLARRVESGNLVDRIQAMRILSHRARRTGKALPACIEKTLRDSEPRARFAAVQAIHESGKAQSVETLWKLAASEKDRCTFYATWRALSDLLKPEEIQKQLKSPQAGARRAALLALLEKSVITGDQAADLRLDRDKHVAELASSFVEKVGTRAEPVLKITTSKMVTSDRVEVRITTSVRDARIRYTLDGSEPADTSSQQYRGPIKARDGTVIHAALFRGRERIGPVITKTVRRSGATVASSSSDVLPVPIANIQAQSGSSYETTTLRIGERAFSNRRYVWVSVPESLAGQTAIQTSNNDADVGSQGNHLLTFQIREDALIYIGHDRRIEKKPEWLSNFKRTKLALVSEDTTYDVYERRFSAGNVSLGGNTVDGQAAGRSQYVVIIATAPLLPRENPTRLEEALALLKGASTERGGRLFFGAATCAKCHRLGDRGNAFAPDLSNLGERADPKIIGQSILDPNAIITEGFHTLVVSTSKGKTYSGFLRQESGLSIELVQADGKVVTIPRKEIEERRRVNTSAMPATMSKLLSPQQVADLITFIKASKVPPTKTPAEKGVSFIEQKDALDILFNGRKVASYVYRHKDVKRPFFAHVKTPTGIQVTRNFPPIKGKDSTDHATMHPGIWLAFARLNSMSFWHNNQGRVVHRGFIGKPTGGERGIFIAINNYQDKTGKVICQERSIISIVPDSLGYIITMDARFTGEKPFTFGVIEEMGLGIRVASGLRVKGGNGTIINSEGGKNEKGTWGKVAKWWDYSGTLQKHQVGMMIMSGPGNPPVWSHSRDYGVLVANPFPVDLPKNRDDTTTIAPGKELRLRFGILIHDQAQGKKLDRAGAYARYLKEVGK